MSDTILDLFPSAAGTASRFGRRQKRERGSRLPVTIVSGFLGAGKTTLVRKFLQSPEGRGTALVVNEFGSVGIDDALLRESTDEVTLLGNGCLCCNTRSDLQIALRRLVADRDRGKIPHFGRVLIETSGLADLSPILQTFSTDRALGGEFAIEVVLTLVDAVNGLRNLDRAPELVDRCRGRTQASPHPGSLRSPTLPLQGRVKRASGQTQKSISRQYSPPR